MGFLVAQMVKSLPAMQETQVQSLGWEDPVEKEMATTPLYSCLENCMDRGAWWAAVQWGHKELDMTDGLKLKVRQRPGRMVLNEGFPSPLPVLLIQDTHTLSLGGFRPTSVLNSSPCARPHALLCL